MKRGKPSEVGLTEDVEGSVSSTRNDAGGWRDRQQGHGSVFSEQDLQPCPGHQEDAPKVKQRPTRTLPQFTSDHGKMVVKAPKHRAFPSLLRRLVPDLFHGFCALF